MANKSIIGPGGTIGILGGGQLGRMLAAAAAEMGLHVHIYCPEENSPAAEISARFTCAEYDDETALTRFAESVDAVTYEFENVPAETARILSEHGIVRPGPIALATAQDRIVEKRFMQMHGILTAPFAEVADEKGLRDAVGSIGTPSVLKTRRFGYDGKGQTKIMKPGDASASWDEIGRAPAILEGFVEFEREISVIVARSLNGETAAYAPVENIHKNHILDRTLAPATLTPALAQEACAIAARIANELDYVGVMGVEMFLLPEMGKRRRLLVNEIAPRVHNSGHWTMDACVVSQFEQHMRAVCGWPLGNPHRHSDAVMTNLIGDEVDAWERFATRPDTAIHLYGKAEARPGRKMGHVTRLYTLGQRPPLTPS